MKIKLFSFFSGCGLLDLGMEEAGFDIAMVSEKSLSVIVKVSP